MLNLSKAVIYTAIVMTGFLQDVSIGPQSIMQKVQSSAVTQTIQPISTEEAKIIASSIVDRIIVAKPQEPKVVIASYYGGENDNFHGKKMANGEIFDENNTQNAAHNELPFGTILTIKSPINGKELKVVIGDRGPRNRDLDVSEAAAEKLGLIEEGVAPLYVTNLELPKDATMSKKEAYAVL